jgi:hypothetical protein
MRKAHLLLPLVLGLACVAALAQSSPAQPTTTQISLGPSAVTLTGPWKFTPGDSPQVNGVPLWSSPALNDSAWTDMDLSSEGGQQDAAYGSSGYVTGWSIRGFPHLSGYAWYRLRVHITGSGHPLWIKMPDHTDDAYQVFANGQYVGEFGRFNPGKVTCYRSRPLIFPLPAPDAQGNMVLAIRFYMEPWVTAGGTTGDSGGMHQAPVIGLHTQIASIYAQAIYIRTLSVISAVFVAIFVLIAAAAAFWIWLLDRPRTTYLWLALGLLLIPAQVALLLIALFSYAIVQLDAGILSIGLASFDLVCWIFFWQEWFLLPANRWLRVTAISFASACFLTGACLKVVPATAALAFWQVQALFTLALGLLFLAPLFYGMRKDRTSALIALPPIVLLAISVFSIELLDWFGIRTSFFPFGVQIGVKDLGAVLFVLVVGVLVARRFLSSQVAQRLDRQAVEQEMEQARELQQHVLTPEAITSSTFTVETALPPRPHRRRRLLPGRPPRRRLATHRYRRRLR